MGAELVWLPREQEGGLQWSIAVLRPARARMDGMFWVIEQSLMLPSPSWGSGGLRVLLLGAWSSLLMHQNMSGITQVVHPLRGSMASGQYGCCGSVAS